MATVTVISDDLRSALVEACNTFLKTSGDSRYVYIRFDFGFLIFTHCNKEGVAKFGPTARRITDAMKSLLPANWDLISE